MSLGAVSATLWSHAGDSHVNQDDWLVHEIDRGVTRIAVIDGVTPWHARPVVGADGAQWAASVVRAALIGNLDPVRALLAANAFLLDETLEWTRQATCACVVVADVQATSNGLRARVVCAGDTEAWVPDGDSWKRIVGGPVLTGTSADLWRTWRDGHRDATAAEVHTAEAAALQDRSAWERTAIGRFKDPRIEDVLVEEASSLILSSDGAWLAGWVRDAAGKDLQRWLERRALQHARDDSTTLQVLSTPVQPSR